MPAATLCCVTVDHGAPEPLYLQLAALLREQIASGQLPSRSKLPTLGQLASDHTLAITTVQKAITLLKDEGLIVAYPGRGMYVA
jgi:DNA-binding transcriptional regulator YhcF (GntR family)